MKDFEPGAEQDQPTPPIASMTFGLDLATGTPQIVMTTAAQKSGKSVPRLPNSFEAQLQTLTKDPEPEAKQNQPTAPEIACPPKQPQRATKALFRPLLTIFALVRVRIASDMSASVI